MSWFHCMLRYCYTLLHTDDKSSNNPVSMDVSSDNLFQLI